MERTNKNDVAKVEFETTDPKAVMKRLEAYCKGISRDAKRTEGKGEK